MGSNDDARRNPSRSRRKGRELREDASKKGAQSRAANEHPRTSSRPVVSVSAGRRRPKVAVADGRERTRGRQTWTAVTDLDGRWRRPTSPERNGRVGGKRKRLLARKEPVSSVSYVVSVKSDGNRRVSRPPSHRGPRRGGGRARERNHTRFFVLSMRAALDPCVAVFA